MNVIDPNNTNVAREIAPAWISEADLDRMLWQISQLRHDLETAQARIRQLESKQETDQAHIKRIQNRVVSLFDRLGE